MTDAPGEDTADSRLQRVQRQIAASRETGRLEQEVIRLKAELLVAQQRRERAGSIRFIALCLTVFLGLAGLLYLQIDSRGSGQLRGALVRQCELRNANLEILKQSFSQQADVAVEQGNPDQARILRSLNDAFQNGNCAELR